MRTEQHMKQMVEKLKTLPPSRVAEVADFIDFLHARDSDRALVRAAKSISQPSLKAIWDNPDDADYDRL